MGGGFDDDQKRSKRVPLKQQLFKLVNLLTFHNVITPNAFMVLLLIEFIQFIGFVFFKISVASQTESNFALPDGKGPTVTGISLSYINYFSMKQEIMDVRASLTGADQG